MSKPFEQTEVLNPTAAESAVERRARVLFLNRSYWPDGEATGQLLTELTEDLAVRFDVTVVAGLPNTNPARESFQRWKSEVRKGVRILRVPHMQLPKRSLAGRAINFITFLAFACVRAVFCKRQDVLVVETDPFLLALLGYVLRIRHGAQLVIYLQDIHPDLGVAIGQLRETWLTRSLRSMLRFVYKRADQVIVLSRDMQRTLVAAGVRERNIECIPNWTDTQRIRPSEGANRFRAAASIPAEAFVVMYSGNLGMTQQLDRVLDAAEMLRSRQDILFVLVGGGSAAAELRDAVATRGLSNVRFFDYQPKGSLGDSLSAADLHIITVHPAALPYLMPSKLYGILAAARAILTSAPRHTELAEVVSSNRLGYVVPSADGNALADVIRQAADDRDETKAMGLRGRQLAVKRYDRAHTTTQFGDMLARVSDAKHRSRVRTPLEV